MKSDVRSHTVEIKRMTVETLRKRVGPNVSVGGGRRVVVFVLRETAQEQNAELNVTVNFC